jgi:hypothetical protein
MKITDWFYPNNKTHLEAYEHLKKNGVWPKDFIPNDLELPPIWQVMLMGKMAECWISYMLDKVNK